MIKSLFGSPKEIFDIPRLVLMPSFSLMSLIDLRVTLALCESDETVSARGSAIIFFLLIPYFSASLTIRSAIASLPSAVSGIPS